MKKTWKVVACILKAMASRCHCMGGAKYNLKLQPDERSKPQPAAVQNTLTILRFYKKKNVLCSVSIVKEFNQKD